MNLFPGFQVAALVVAVNSVIMNYASANGNFQAYFMNQKEDWSQSHNVGATVSMMPNIALNSFFKRFVI